MDEDEEKNENDFFDLITDPANPDAFTNEILEDSPEDFIEI